MDEIKNFQLFAILLRPLSHHIPHIIQKVQLVQERGQARFQVLLLVLIRLLLANSEKVGLEILHQLLGAHPPLQVFLGHAADQVKYALVAVPPQSFEVEIRAFGVGVSRQQLIKNDAQRVNVSLFCVDLVFELGGLVPRLGGDDPVAFGPFLVQIQNVEKVGQQDFAVAEEEARETQGAIDDIMSVESLHAQQQALENSQRLLLLDSAPLAQESPQISLLVVFVNVIDVVFGFEVVDGFDDQRAFYGFDDGHLHDHFLVEGARLIDLSELEGLDSDFFFCVDVDADEHLVVLLAFEQSDEFVVVDEF